MHFSLAFLKKPINFSKNKTDIFNKLSSEHVYHKNENGDWILWIGDYVPSPGQKNLSNLLRKNLDHFNIQEIIASGGFYYCFHFSSKNQELKAVTGLFNIMPIYYLDQPDKLVISSDPKFIVDSAPIGFSVNKNFILEKTLFNFPFGDNTIYSKIKMLEGNRFITINKAGIKIIAHTDILEWIYKDPTSIKKAKPELVELLNSRIDAYLPDEEFYLSFTGGFDGRTILSRALNTNKDFVAYSFGTPESQDIRIPLAQSKKLGVNFKPFYLDDQNYLSSSLNCGLEMVDITAAMSTLSRAHYVYASQQISKTNKYIVTGNFGSELFRAFHSTGVMVTPFMYGLFNTTNIEEFLDNYAYAELRPLNMNVLKDDLIQLKHYLASSNKFETSGFTKNQVFYKYLFEDIFRKYFGSEIVMQRQYLFNRTPFIDYSFIKELLKSKLAGVHSKFYESNPVKRLKGQLLYANVIKNNSLDLYHMRTGKGYKPRNVSSNSGRAYLLYNLLKKNLLKSEKQSDDFGVKGAFNYNLSTYTNMEFTQEIFEEKFLKNAIEKQEVNLSVILNALSLNWYINKYF